MYQVFKARLNGLGGLAEELTGEHRVDILYKRGKGACREAGMGSGEGVVDEEDIAD